MHKIARRIRESLIDAGVEALREDYLAVWWNYEGEPVGVRAGSDMSRIVYARPDDMEGPTLAISPYLQRQAEALQYTRTPNLMAPWSQNLVLDLKALRKLPLRIDAVVESVLGRLRFLKDAPGLFAPFPVYHDLRCAHTDLVPAGEDIEASGGWCLRKWEEGWAYGCAHMRTSNTYIATVWRGDIVCTHRGYCNQHRERAGVDRMVSTVTDVLCRAQDNDLNIFFQGADRHNVSRDVGFSRASWRTHDATRAYLSAIIRVPGHHVREMHLTGDTILSSAEREDLMSHHPKAHRNWLLRKFVTSRQGVIFDVDDEPGVRDLLHLGESVCLGDIEKRIQELRNEGRLSSGLQTLVAAAQEVPAILDIVLARPSSDAPKFQAFVGSAFDKIHCGTYDDLASARASIQQEVSAISKDLWDIRTRAEDELGTDAVLQVSEGDMDTSSVPVYSFELISKEGRSSPEP